MQINNTIKKIVLKYIHIYVKIYLTFKRRLCLSWAVPGALAS